MKTLALFAAFALVTLVAAPDAMAQKASKKSAQPQCLNALACGPQPVPKVRKPKNEKFMKSAS